MNNARHFQVKLMAVLAVLCFIAGSRPLKGQQGRLLQPEDLFTLKEVHELRLSPDGRAIIFSMRETDLKGDRNVSTLWRLVIDGKSQPTRLTDSDQDSSPQWSPDGKMVGFLSTRGGSAQVWVLNLASGQIEKITDVPTAVSSFKWSPDGVHLAFTAREVKKDSYGQAINSKEKKGVVIDKKTFSFFQLIRNQLFLDLENPTRLWLLDISSRKVEELTKTLSVDSFAWAPDGRSLAISANGAQDSLNSSIFLYSLPAKTIKQIFRDERGDVRDYAITYSAPFWSPDGKTLAVLYRDQKDRWSATGRVGIYSLESGKFSLITTEEGLELYNHVFNWIQRDEIYLENTHQAGRHLFAVSAKDGSLRSILNSDGYDNFFSFSADGSHVAFVRQTLQQPPEIYLADAPFKVARKLTSLNLHLAGFQLPRTERVQWTSTDGKQVEGWLFTPLNFEEGKAYPLLVMVHGGPTFVAADRFEPYASDRGGWIWPYPFRIFAGHGYAVFLPNYRGTGSYGKSFRQFSDEFKEPSDDIVTGISFLVKKGIADPNLVGIMGQSHGALLGPSVMAHHRIFKASSFAEGLGNFITSYAYVPGKHNLDIGEYYSGGDPYNNPQRYIERSSIFHFQGLSTATLLEFGEQSTALLGLEMLSALWRQGVPHEMIIYPKTGHNLSSPVLQLESIKRNLDWFDYWMLGKKDPAPTKLEQYARWEKMTQEMKVMRARNSTSPRDISIR